VLSTLRLLYPSGGLLRRVKKGPQKKNGQQWLPAEKINGREKLKVTKR